MAVAHKSAISVGLIHIPVGLYKTTKDISVSFNQLCKESGERIKYKKYCPSCQKEVTGEDIIKGYEFEKGKYVTISNEELERIKTRKDRTIHVLHFAKMADIDQLYYEKNYYAVPEPGGEKPFELFRQALLAKKEVAVAMSVIGTKVELLVLYPTKSGLIAKILFYQEEIQAVPVQPLKTQVSREELEMAKSLVESMTKPFEPEQYHDEYQARLRNAIETKIRGQEIVAEQTAQGGNVIDFMEALKKTVEMAENQKGSA